MRGGVGRARSGAPVVIATHRPEEVDPRGAPRCHPGRRAHPAGRGTGGGPGGLDAGGASATGARPALRRVLAPARPALRRPWRRARGRPEGPRRPRLADAPRGELVGPGPQRRGQVHLPAPAPRRGAPRPGGRHHAARPGAVRRRPGRPRAGRARLAGPAGPPPRRRDRARRGALRLRGQHRPGSGSHHGPARGGPRLARRRWARPTSRTAASTPSPTGSCAGSSSPARS